MSRDASRTGKKRGTAAVLAASAVVTLAVLLYLAFLSTSDDGNRPDVGETRPVARSSVGEARAADQAPPTFDSPTDDPTAVAIDAGPNPEDMPPGSYLRTDDAGVRHYALDYKCVAKFKKNTMWSFGRNGFETTDPLPDNAKRKERKKAEERLAGKKPAKSGDTVAVKGSVEFESKESGWIVTNVTLSLDR